MVESSVEKTELAPISHESNEADIINEIVIDDYCLVGWDLDVTGRKLLDEICHIAAYTPDDSFSLYIMPYGDLNVFATKRHMIKIVTVNYYRIIKDLTTNKTLKTKSELSALVDFLDWLEKLCKKSEKNGILLLCHESYTFNPHLLIKSLMKYDLLERFSSVVKGFVDCHSFAKKKCEQTMVSFSIRILAKVLLSKENVEIYKASDRARLAYDIVQHLCAGNSEIGKGAASPNMEIIRTVLPYTSNLEQEKKVLDDLQIVISRQNTLKPIFIQFLGHRFTTYHERRNALQLRKLLVDAFVDYDMLKNAWTRGKEALEELINDKLSSDEISEKQKEDLTKLITNHFENPEEPKKKNGSRGRFPRKHNKRSPSNKSDISDTKTTASGSDKSEEGEIKDELPDICHDLQDSVTPLQNSTKANAVAVN